MHGVRPRLPWLLLAAASACGIAGTALAARTSGQAATVESSESRAIGYLSREVPAWRRDHPCYSCHNNGDAARALIAALRRNHPVRPALDDTLAWLGQPSRWRTNGGGEGGGDDKRLARIQFANATAVAAEASLVPAAALAAAAEIVAADQQPDGSWRLDSSDSIGSPATYGTALATFYARRSLAVSGLPAMTARVARADRWLAALEPVNVPDAAAVLFALAGTTSARPAGWHASLTLLASGQGRSGGWGPYATSPAEPFDTALAVLALAAVKRGGATTAPAFTPASLDEAIEQGRGYLLSSQLNDGSWPETTRPAGQASYAQRISTTAWALLAIIETAPRR